jgi:hypothetical protein
MFVDEKNLRETRMSVRRIRFQVWWIEAMP